MAQQDIICKNFFSDNQKLYTNVLMSWNKLSCQNRLANKQTLVNYIVNTNEFKQYYNDKCQSYGNKILNGEILEKDKIGYLKNIQNDGEFNLKNFQKFIKSLEDFKTHYTTLFNSLYSHYSNQDLTNNQLVECFSKINDIDLMNVNIDEEIHKIIQKLCHGVYNKKPIIEDIDQYTIYFKDIFKEKLNKELSEKDLISFETFIKNKQSLIDLYINLVYKNYDKNFNNITGEFLDIFGREITVYEFKLFYDDFKLNSNEYFNKYKKIYDLKFKILNNLYKKFYNHEINYIILTKLYLEFIYDNENDFEQKIIDIIINTDEYKSVMVNKISKIYKDTYSININNQDIEYIFNKIYLKKYNLESDDLIKYVSELKNETDKNLLKINEIYNEILLRKPDESENEYYINYFRDVKELAPEFYIKEELYESLEYNDVLKNK